MAQKQSVRFIVIAVLLLLGVWWSLASADRGAALSGYPGGRFLATADWVKQHHNDPGLIIVDVRDDEHFDGKLIPGAIRMPWIEFRYTDRARGIDGVFVGPARAQKILGSYGITRNDEVVLYDSVDRDGGATASYVFWVLDLLGHEKMRILERGIDAWAEAGNELATTPRQVEPLLYQAPAAEIDLRRQVDGRFIYDRLGDVYYQLLDVRSPGEYLGENPNPALDGSELKRGHIPTAVNREYTSNWVDQKSKAIKPYSELLEHYRGLDPSKAVITYCHSARRGSYGYYILRLMGLQDVRLYDASWYEWGSRQRYFPAETLSREFTGKALPKPGMIGGAGPVPAPAKKAADSGTTSEQPKGGYVSCGG
jgi:thiosulfate/3-mercaptopyruvate sulfurtransferase